jgi:hypothetical protein
MTIIIFYILGKGLLMLAENPTIVNVIYVKNGMTLQILLLPTMLSILNVLTNIKQHVAGQKW